MSNYKRIRCPKCNNENNKLLYEEPDKSKVLYYSMQGTPVYKTIIKCGLCGHKWNKT
ncbi:MAG: hypothetical protein ACTSYC_06780 [Promethearchaeota archaeon]